MSENLTTPSIDFYPRSPCGERLVGASQGADIGNISIHALLAESDAPPYNLMIQQTISIHALLAESDPGERHASSQQEKFLSTLSLRRATTTWSRPQHGD